MNFLLTPIGSAGDVHPYLGIGQALQRRGHRVTIATNPHFEVLVRQTGLDFSPVGTTDQFESFLADPDLWHRTRAWKVALRYGALGTMRRLYDLAAEVHKQGDGVVAGPGMAFGLRIAHEKLGVPFASLHLEPDKFRSLRKTPVMQPPMMLHDWVPKYSKRIQLWLADAIVDRFAGPEVNAFRRDLGLCPVRRLVHRWWHSPQRAIGLFPSWYCPYQSDWPRQSVLTGFPIWDRSEQNEPPAELVTWLARHPGPIVFTPGTGNRHASRFFESAAAACRILGRPGVLLTPHREQGPAELPEGVICVPYVPFRYLLPRAGALVHHAGIGTTAQGLLAGVPHVVMPMTFSQPDDAARLVRLGVAESLQPHRFTAGRLAAALKRLLRSPLVAARCQELARRFEGADPIQRACDELENVGSSRLSARSTAAPSLTLAGP